MKHLAPKLTSDKGIASLDDIRGRSLRHLSQFGDFNLLYRAVARIDEAKCIHCNLCHIACEDSAHQCIDMVPMDSWKQPRVRESDCVGCALCSLVCPVEECISMVRIDEAKRRMSWNELVKTLPQPLTWEELRAFQKKHGIEIH